MIDSLLAAAKKRTLCVLEKACKNAIRQLTINQREAVFQRALYEDINLTLPVQIEASCPVVYQRVDGRTTIVATERFDLLVTSETNKWSSIIEVKKGIKTRDSALAQLRRYRENYNKSFSSPLAACYLVIFYGHPVQYEINLLEE